MRKLLALSVIAMLLLVSCSPYNQVLKGNDYNLKLSKANEYYDAGKWLRAGELYNQVLPVFKATKDYEMIYYRYAYTQYNTRNYLSASYHFKNFTEFFPGSSKAEECMYMYGVSLFKDSPRYNLDATSTSRAREVLVHYVNTYPTSPTVPDAMKYIEECTEKLETKGYHAALLYYNMEQYKAATVAFKELIATYIESKKTDYYMYLQFRSAFLYAQQSVLNKQQERYVDAIAIYKEFKNFYPNSSYTKEADKLFDSAEKSIKQLRNEHK